ncbi:uncharacterized protein At4g06598 [Diospyros lotus]|uniref:uncharacterized protein At4g06598 n=1 Tax=Diospyros lotus TaxID=55363 RepID=UPI00225B27E5|nr:uncharacterized protein At4g06598 [Diospyros lotus]XP_052204719.1 uncharacterized protein At4g06598 [Diospyros lotus]
MANVKGSSNIKNVIYNGKHPLLPPKSPFPTTAPSYVDYISSPAIGPKGIAKPREINSHHQRTSSESFLMEEQPSWLDELLNEPETPVRKGGHRRSSSDSFTYVDVVNASPIDYVPQDGQKYKNLISAPSWGSQDYEHYKDVQHDSFYAEPKSLGKSKNLAWDLSLSTKARPSALPSGRDIQSSGSSCVPQELEQVSSTDTEKQDLAESGLHDPKAASERKDPSHAKPSASEADTKRAKQQYAQRSRVRKLQYIAELEGNVQALQAKGSETSAELEFLNQQNLILSMENKALKKRLDGLAQEQLIKYLEHEVLERELGRLRALYQQQQQQQEQQPPSSGHRRTNSRDLDSQFAKLSMKHKDNSSGRVPISGPLHI